MHSCFRIPGNAKKSHQMIVFQHANRCSLKHTCLKTTQLRGWLLHQPWSCGWYPSENLFLDDHVFVLYDHLLGIGTVAIFPHQAWSLDWFEVSFPWVHLASPTFASHLWWLDPMQFPYSYIILPITCTRLLKLYNNYLGKFSYITNLNHWIKATWGWSPLLFITIHYSHWFTQNYVYYHLVI